jgi:hypothetical protein
VKHAYFFLQRMLRHIHALRQICLEQLVLQDHCKFQVRDDQYIYDSVGSVSTEHFGIIF